MNIEKLIQHAVELRTSGKLEESEILCGEISAIQDAIKNFKYKPLKGFGDSTFLEKIWVAVFNDVELYRNFLTCSYDKEKLEQHALEWKQDYELRGCAGNYSIDWVYTKPEYKTAMIDALNCGVRIQIPFTVWGTTEDDIDVNTVYEFEVALRVIDLDEFDEILDARYADAENEATTVHPNIFAEMADLI